MASTEERLARMEALLQRTSEDVTDIKASVGLLTTTCPRYRERVDTNRKLLIITWVAVVGKWIASLADQYF